MNKGFLIVVFIFHCFYIHAQYNFDVDHLGEITNNLEYERLMTDREYQVLSAFDTISKLPLKVYAVAGRNNKFGIIDTNGEEITPIIYDDIWLDYVDIKLNSKQDSKTTYSIIAVKHERFGLLDLHGNEITDFKYKFMDRNQLNGKNIFVAWDKNINVFNFDSKGTILDTHYNADQLNSLNIQRWTKEGRKNSSIRIDRTSSEAYTNVYLKEIDASFKIRGKT